MNLSEDNQNLIFKYVITKFKEIISEKNQYITSLEKELNIYRSNNEILIKEKKDSLEELSIYKNNIKLIEESYDLIICDNCSHFLIDEESNQCSICDIILCENCYYVSHEENYCKECVKEL